MSNPFQGAFDLISAARHSLESQSIQNLKDRLRASKNALAPALQDAHRPPEPFASRFDAIVRRVRKADDDFDGTTPAELWSIHKDLLALERDLDARRTGWTKGATDG